MNRISCHYHKQVNVSITKDGDCLELLLTAVVTFNAASGDRQKRNLGKGHPGEFQIDVSTTSGSAFSRYRR
jgi:hypothetical protein